MSTTERFQIEVDSFNLLILQNCADILQEFYLFVKRISYPSFPDIITVFEKCTIENCLYNFKLIGQAVKEVFYFVILDKNLHCHVNLLLSFASVISTYNFLIFKILCEQRENVLKIVTNSSQKNNG